MSHVPTSNSLPVMEERVTSSLCSESSESVELVVAMGSCCGEPRMDVAATPTRKRMELFIVMGAHWLNGSIDIDQLMF